MRYSIICFDLDGTLIDNIVVSWQRVHDFLDISKEKRELAKKNFFMGRISYSEWAQHDIYLWKEVNATRKDICSAFNNVILMQGALETLETLRSAGLIIGLISGSFDVLLDMLSIREYFDFIYINQLVFDKSGKVHHIIPTQYDFTEKAKALILEAKKRGIPLSRTVFVGDNYNDIRIAKTAGMSIAFNSKSKNLSEVCHINIMEKNLKRILPYILNNH